MRNKRATIGDNNATISRICRGGSDASSVTSMFSTICAARPTLSSIARC